MRGDEESEPGNATALLSIEMLKAVVDGETYDAVAGRFGVTRTAVERRIKTVAVQLSQRVGIEGLNQDATAFVQRLRQHRAAILAALDEFEPAAPFGPRASRVVSNEEIAQAAQRIKGRSSRPWHDQALFYLLFATGARPLEIARLEVRDYLNPDGSVRVASEMRAEAAISGKARPLYFTSTRLDGVLDRYLAERLAQGLGLGDPTAFRGLDPRSMLFLSPAGEGFRITEYGEEGQRRHLCRPILETYRKLFRYAELRGVTPLSVRLTLAARLYERGGDEEQVGLLLGISARSAVRELFPRPRPSVPELMREVV
jgi:integrase